MPLRYLLDQNFPIHVAALSWPPSLLVERLSSVDADLTRATEDWEVILELQHRGADGFVTNDEKIVKSAREMVALSHTTLTLVVASGVGDDALKATGLVMVHLGDIAADSAIRPMTYVLRPAGKSAANPGKRITDIAVGRKADRAALVRDERNFIIEQLQLTRPHLLSLFVR